MFEFTDEIGEPFFELSQFLSAVFGQDFSFSYRSETAGVGEYISHTDHSVRSTMVHEIDDLLLACPGEDQLRDAIGTLGAAYMAPGTAPAYKRFVLRLRARLVESLAEMPTLPEEAD